jgi:hypothetical protein
MSGIADLLLLTFLALLMRFQTLFARRERFVNIFLDYLAGLQRNTVNRGDHTMHRAKHVEAVDFDSPIFVIRDGDFPDIRRRKRLLAGTLAHVLL